MQAKLMQNPSLVLFRTKSDALKGSTLFNYYVYRKISSRKKLLRMLSIEKKLKKVISDFKLDIYGTRIMEETLKKFIIDHSLTSNVELKGFCQDMSVYKDYSLLWITSDYEGFGLVIIEAKANGVPTISTNWGEGVFEVNEKKKMD